MSDQLPLEGTEYEIPLTDAQLAELGRFTATFSQIDFLMGEAIGLLTKTPWWAMMLMLDGATTGPKLNILRRIIPEIKDKAARKKTKDVCEHMGALIERRNHVIHGMWTQILISSKKAAVPGCFFNKRKDAAVYADELRQITNRGAKVSRLLGELISMLSRSPYPPWKAPRRMFVSNEKWDDAAPDWIKAPGPLQKTDY